MPPRVIASRAIFGLLVALQLSLPMSAAALLAGEGSPDSSPSNLVRQTRQRLDLYGITLADLGEASDGADSVGLLRILYAMTRFDRLSLHRFSLPAPAAANLVADVETLRGGVFQLSGTVIACEQRPLPAAQAERFEMQHYYRCLVRLDVTDETVLVWSAAVPSDWLAKTPLAEPTSFTGLLAAVTSDVHYGELPVFFSKRLAWHPATTLGKLGMDVGLLETVEQRTPLQAGESEAFYQMLAAVGRTDLPHLLRLAQDDYPVAPLFNAPELQVGRLLAVSGVARRAIPIVVDPVIAERLGVDQYYEIEVVTPDSQGNPLTFCVRQLPAGMPVGEDIHERVRIPGFFLKTWTFRSQELQDQQPTAATAEQGPWTPTPPQTKRQIAPLLIGLEPLWHAPARAPFYSPEGAMAGGMFVLFLASVWSLLWWQHRRNRQYAKQTLARIRHDSAESLALDETLSPPADASKETPGPNESVSHDADTPPIPPREL